MINLTRIIRFKNFHRASSRGCALMHDWKSCSCLTATGVVRVYKKRPEKVPQRKPNEALILFPLTLTFPQVLWISQGKLLAEGVFLFLFQPSDSLCLIFKHPSFFWHPFHGGRPQGRATRFAIVVKCALRNFAISLGLPRSLCSQALGLCAACFMTTIEIKDLSKKDKDRANVPIQNPSGFIKSNDDWMGVRSCRVFQGSPLFHGMKRAVLEHF